MKPRIYLSDCSGSFYRNDEDFFYVKNFMHDTITRYLTDKGYLFDTHVAPEETTEPVSLKGYSGLIILGGYDISPELYGADAIASTSAKSCEVDRREIALVNEAVSLNLPVFGICRGMQLLNVAFGGSLHQDNNGSGIIHHNFPAPHPQDRLVVHPVEVSNSSVLQDGCYNVASAHHQSIDRLGSGLTVTAYSDDGTVEMIENPLLNIIGTQWHPEDSRVEQDDTLNPILSSFLAAAVLNFQEKAA